MAFTILNHKALTIHFGNRIVCKEKYTQNKPKNYHPFILNFHHAAIIA
jgi:hypothetical protein